MAIQHPTPLFNSSRRGGLSRTVAAVLGALAVSSSVLACSGGSSGWRPDDDSDAAGNSDSDIEVGLGGKSGKVASSGTASGKSSSAACAERPTDAVALNQAIWQTGFKVTLGTARLQAQTPSCTPGVLTIDAQFENRGTETQTFDAVTLLSSSGKDYELPGAQGFPRVPGGRLGKGTFSFEVDGTFSLEDAVLSFGAAERHQAKVPFGKDSPDPLVTLEPQTLPITGTVVAGDLTVNIEDAFLRADSPGGYSSLAADEVHLSLGFNAMVTKDLVVGDYLGDKAFVLQLPDGTSIAPDAVPSVTLRKNGVTESGLWVGFTIPSPAAGRYSLDVREYDYSTRATAVFPFTLPGFPMFGDE